MPNTKGSRSYTISTKKFPADPENKEGWTKPIVFFQEINQVMQSMYNLLTNKELFKKFVKLSDDQRDLVLDQLLDTYPKGWHLLENLPDLQVDLEKILNKIMEDVKHEA